jgi:hypothetical protein
VQILKARWLREGMRGYIESCTTSENLCPQPPSSLACPATSLPHTNTARRSGQGMRLSAFLHERIAAKGNAGNLRPGAQILVHCQTHTQKSSQPARWGCHYERWRLSAPVVYTVLGIWVRYAIEEVGDDVPRYTAAWRSSNSGSVLSTTSHI